MRRVEALVLLSTAATSVLCADTPRPRGVGPEFAKFYKNAETFACISSPSIILPIGLVNDNYCDCPDGSDEPGTAACTYLSPVSPEQPVHGSVSGSSNIDVVLPGYYCKNKGHQPGYVPFTYVNDGVCDYELCCDGSDEWEGVGGIKCEDRCAAIGKEYKNKEKAKAKSAFAAGKRRAELVAEARTLRAGVENNIAKLEDEIKVLEIKAAEATKRFEDVERRERGRVVNEPTGKASKVTILAGLAKNRIEELRGALVGMVQKRNEARQKVAELEAILATFKEEHNPNFNDEGVKRAVKAWEDYAAKKASVGETDTSAEDRDVEDITKEDNEENGINWTDWAEEEESDVEALYRFEEYLPTAVRDWIHHKVSDFRVLLVENGILADNANSGSESRAVSDARSASQAINSELTDKQGQVSEQKQDLSESYGPDDVFRALKGSCVEQDSGEYTYELCWLDKTTQKSKKGGGNTGMGNYVRFDTVVVDEEVSDDGKGLGVGERIALRYENGQHCWNGPNRQTTVVLACAEKDEIWKIVEEEKCVYRMEVGTPAACDPARQDGATVGKDELELAPARLPIKYPFEAALQDIASCGDLNPSSKSPCS